MKKKLLNYSLFYYFYKRIKIVRNSFKSFHFGEYGEDILLEGFLKNLKKVFMLMLVAIILSKDL